MQAQIHEQFKVFSGSTMGEVMQSAYNWASDGTFSPKSISVELVSGRWVLTIGYRDDQDGHSIRIVVKSLGHFTTNEEFEDKIHEVLDDVENVICHDMFAEFDGEVMIIVMVGN